MNDNTLYFLYKPNQYHIHDYESSLNKKIIIQMIIKDIDNIKYLPKELLGDENFILEIYEKSFVSSKNYKNVDYYNKLPNNLKQNDKFLLKLIKIKPNFLTTIPENRININIAIKSIRMYPYLIKKLPPIYKKNKGLISLVLKMILIKKINYLKFLIIYLN